MAGATWPPSSGCSTRWPGPASLALGVFDSASGPLLVQHQLGTNSLAEALRADRLPLARPLDLARQRRDLRTCPRQRVIHRSIKPANILYDAARGAIALGDFASAIELPVNARAVPAGDFVGTAAYASPWTLRTLTKASDAHDVRVESTKLKDYDIDSKYCSRGFTSIRIPWPCVI